MAISEAGIKLVAEGVDAYERDIKRANDSTQKFARDTEGTKGGFESWSSIVRGAFEKVGGLVTEQLANAGKALIGFGMDSINLAGQFETGMNKFAAAASLPADEIKDFEKLFIDLGKELPVSTMETVEAATALIKGGIDPTVVAAGALRDTLNFAAAAGLGLEESADIVAKQVGQFVPVAATAAEKTDFMAKSMDLMTKVAGASTVDVAELAAGMAQAGGVANAIGLDYEDFAVTMGAISPAFNSAQEAGTSLKNFLTRLQPASAPAFNSMRDLGLITGDTEAMMKFLQDNGVKPLSSDMGSLDQQVRTFLKSEKKLSESQIEKTMSGMTKNAFFANGELLSMQEIVGTLETATKGLTDEQKVNYLQTIFGADAMNTVVTLAGMGVEGFDSFAAAVGRANGVTEQAEAVNKGYEYQMGLLEGALEGFKISIGGPMRDALAPYIGLMAEAVEVAGTLFEIFTDKPPDISQSNDPITQMAKNLQYAAEQKEKFESLPEPIQRVVLAVQEMLTHQDEFVAGLTETFNWLMETLAPVGDLITTVFGGVYTVLETIFTGPLFAQIMTTITQVAATLIEKFAYVADMLTPIVDQILGIINTMAAYMSETLAPVIKGITDVLTGPEVSGAFNAIVDLIGSVMTLALEVVMIAWDALVIGIEYAKPVFEVVFGVLKTVFETAFKVISLGIPVITELINGVIALFRGDTTGAFQDLSMVAQAAWTGIVRNIELAGAKIMGIVQPLINGIKAKFDEMVTAALTFGKDIVQGLINGINAKIADVMKAAGNLVDEIKKKLNVGFLFGSPSKVTMEMGEWIGEGMSIGMDKTTRDVLESSQNLVMAARAPMMSATGGGGASTVTNNYNLGVSTTASPTVIVRSYNLMRGSV